MTKLSELASALSVKIERRYQRGDHFGLSPVLVFSKRGKVRMQVFSRQITDPGGKHFEDDLA